MNRKGFTLVELLVVVLILGALATLAVPRITGSAFKAKINVCRTNVDLMNSKIELYYIYTGSWPTTLKDVTADPNYFPDGPPKCPFNTPYILDTIKGKNRVPDHLHPMAKEVEAIQKEE
jgi:prepilin-type N-terminal cleavage/methylation domain-containing protein